MTATLRDILTRFWQVLSGDFHQLPPVAKGAAAANRRFAFEAASWSRCVDVCYQLTTVHRQVLAVRLLVLPCPRLSRCATESCVEDHECSQ